MTTAAVEPELTEAEQRAALNTGILMHYIAKKPAGRAKVLGLIKEAAPDLVIPELDIVADVDRRVTERVKPYEDSAAALVTEVRELKTTLARRDMQHKLGLADDELVEVETLAKEKGISNIDTATEFYRLRDQVLGTPRATRDPGAEDYHQKLRKINPRDQAGLKRAVLAESQRLMGRRAG